MPDDLNIDSLITDQGRVGITSDDLRALGLPPNLITKESLEDNGVELRRGLQAHRTRIAQLRRAGLDEELRRHIQSITEPLSALQTSVRHIVSAQPLSGTSPDFQKNAIGVLSSLRDVFNTIDRPTPGDGKNPRLSEDYLDRARARVARSHLKRGENIPEEMVGRFQEAIKKLDSEVSGLQRDFMDTVETNPEAASRIAMVLQGKSNLSQELRNLLEANSKEQKGGLDKTLNFITSLASTLGISTLVANRVIQDPFQYEFQPAMQALGKQGPLGSLLGSAFTTAEGYDVQGNTQGFYSGLGLGTMGLSTAMRGGTGNIIGGGLMALTGGTLSALGLSGNFNDILQKLGIKLSDDTIIGNQIASQLADPTMLTNAFEGSRAGLFAVGGAGGANSFLLNEAADARLTRTGNVILDRLMERTSSGVNLGQLGFTGAEAGKLLSSASMRVAGGAEELFDATNFAGVVSKAYGVDTNEVLAQLQTAQMGGSRDAIGTVRAAQRAVAGPDQELSNYEQNVLVPALLNVVQSSAVRNISRTSEDIQKEVFGLRMSLEASPDENFTALLTRNPQIFSQIYGSIQGATKSALNDPALLNQFLAMPGVSFLDVVQGKAAPTVSLIQRYAQSPIFNGLNTLEDATSFQANLANTLSGVFGGSIDTQTMLELIVSARNGNLSAEDFQKAIDTSEVGTTKERAEAFATSAPGELEAKLAEQSNNLLIASQSLNKQVLQMQDMLLTFSSGETLKALAQRGIDQIVDQIRQVMSSYSSTSSKSTIDTSTQFLDQTPPPKKRDLTDVSQQDLGALMSSLRIPEAEALKRGDNPFTSKIETDYTPEMLYQDVGRGYWNTEGKPLPGGYNSESRTEISRVLGNPKRFGLAEQAAQRTSMDVSTPIRNADNSYTVTVNVTGSSREDVLNTFSQSIYRALEKNMLLDNP